MEERKIQQDGRAYSGWTPTLPQESSMSKKQTAVEKHRIRVIESLDESTSALCRIK